MKFGIFLLLQSPDMRPSQETYDHALEQGVLADQLGFDYIVAAEHHFSSYGFLPCPLLLIPTLAERTKQLDTFIQPALVNDGISRVTGHVKHRQAGPQLRQPRAWAQRRRADRLA